MIYYLYSRRYFMITDKLKALITLRHTTQAELAEKRNISRQQFNLKITRNAFKPKELIELAIDTNTKLAFIDENNQPVIIFDENDIIQKDIEH